MSNKIALTLFVAVFLHIQVAFTWTDFELVRFDNIVGGTLCRSYLKLKRIDRGTYGISGRIEFINDFSNDWKVKLAFGIPKDGICNIINGIYITSGYAEEWATVSDLPAPKPNEGICKDYKKGNYTIREHPLVRRSVIPKYLPTGLYKVEEHISGKDTGENGSIVIYLKLY